MNISKNQNLFNLILIFWKKQLGKIKKNIQKYCNKEIIKWNQEIIKTKLSYYFYFI